MRMIVAISGPIGVGKSAFADELTSRFEAKRVSTRQFIIDRLGTPNERGALQAAGAKLDQDTDGEWVADAVANVQRGSPAAAILLVDSVRIVKQVEKLRQRFGGNLLHVHLTASRETLSARYLARQHEVKEFATYDEVLASPIEAAIGELAKVADIVLDTDKSDPPALVARAMSGKGFYPEKVEPLVDVIVGGQYGSEGKGNICSFLASGYDVLMRIGGPNAGHLVAEPRYKYVQLPSGTGSNPRAKVLIGAGSTIWLPQLMLEIMDHRLEADALSIDPQAMIIDDEDRRIESRTLNSIASTKQGVGAATARKILGRGSDSPFGPPVTLARDVDQIKKFVRDTKVELERAYSAGHKIMLEGTQGTSLSLHHGLYPSVTSRETTTAGCLSDAGIAPRRVRRVIMVTRTYPIRVGGTSGPMSKEIDFQAISKRSNVPLDELLAVEKGTISRTQRRIAEFDWDQLRRSTILNGPTDIAITFADYLGIQNRSAVTFDDLLPETKAFIAEVERVSATSVSLISTRFAKDGVIDRRDWK